MQFNNVIIYVEDVVKTVEFYEQAFDQKIKLYYKDNIYAELNTGAVTLSFVQETYMEDNVLKFVKNRRHTSPAGFEIVFATKDVDQAFENAISAGAVEIMYPNNKPWGQRVAHIKDINGVTIEICSIMEGEYIQ